MRDISSRGYLELRKMGINYMSLMDHGTHIYQLEIGS